MKPLKLFALIAVLLLLVGSIIAATSYGILKKTKQTPDKKFYVGVTYCGSSVQEAKELIDEVKNYTNLFILQSGPLMNIVNRMNEIGDYAIASNLNYAIYGSKVNYNLISYNGTTYRTTLGLWLIDAKERWGEQFTGIYYFDEPGGNMLDGVAPLEQITNGTITSIQRGYDGLISINNFFSANNESISRCDTYYYPNGRITILNTTMEKIENESKLLQEEMTNSTNISSDAHKQIDVNYITEYFPNGTITIQNSIYESIVTHGTPIIEKNSTIVYTTENITKFHSPIQPYEQVLKQKPNTNP
jgi:hypothetical protein